MNKFVVNGLLFFVFFVFSSISQATLITNLTQAELDSGDFSNAEDHLVGGLLDINYINYKGYDWAWVSPVNIESFGGNTLYNPDLQKNWIFADKTLLTILKTELTIADFTADNGDIIQAAKFFNSEYEHVDSDNFRPDALSSELTDPNHFLADLLQGFETFYVREALTTGVAPSPIPEPLSILLFAVAFIILQSKLKNKSA
ncbi:hypothetical protein [Colwellia psychrerythraea]|uniref:PEP motif anchor domain protein n=1 Tax=Colwellia psychrerythraea TaxID=28229 RepID=A0A099KNL3_COLPS|nr:hypothetical protein [Colwellia psychrerythraea]KGJ92359.1 hypothetical protein GAB14E_0481 [Colwellia psychrerythraea]